MTDSEVEQMRIRLQIGGLSDEETADLRAKVRQAEIDAAGEIHPDKTNTFHTRLAAARETGNAALVQAHLKNMWGLTPRSHRNRCK